MIPQTQDTFEKKVGVLVRSQIKQELPVLLRDKEFRREVSQMVQREGKQIIVTTPYKLSPTELTDLRKCLGIERTSLELVNEVDSDLIMGMIVQSNSYYADFSLRGRIDSLLQSLK